MTRAPADVVVVAAGASERFGGDKLEAAIDGRPLLGWTLERLAASDVVGRIVVVTAGDRVERIRAASWLPSKVTDVVPGGTRRQESVAAGIAAAAELDAAHPDEAGDRVILVHDGARPLVSSSLIEAVTAAVHAHGAAVPVLPIRDTVKRAAADGRIVETLDRADLFTAQTPQGATLAAFERAYRTVDVRGPASFTDEAALLEACRIPVHAIPGDERNLKVTVPADLDRVAAGLGLGGLRVGFGDDAHPFGPGAPLALGGLDHPGSPRLHGHSDGDVVLHAVADALLGATGLGDLGRIFPADARTPRGIASAELLAGVLARLAAAGWRPGTIDVTIVAARPRLSPRLDAIRDRLAELLGIEPGAVNVKASTGNLAGFEGAGRGISARAIATVERAR
ncbi:MAG TPA: 2-C-methyl-D-erythritol 2,4-cyclodiphosphate synthase [Candidatus Limnocylindrales bacterium]|nr:2-C-methyl-D-erythritol 2,4-cyclodiphosphate synthase [Candidatus Limnocylindrales bacterium]